MREAKARMGTRPNPSCREIAARSLRASGVTPASCRWNAQLVFWPRRRRKATIFVRQNVRQNHKEEHTESMAIIKAPPKEPKSVTIQARVEESVKTRLDQYAKFIDSTPVLRHYRGSETSVP